MKPTDVEEGRVMLDGKTLGKLRKTVSDIKGLEGSLGNLLIQYELAKEDLVNQTKRLIETQRTILEDIKEEYGIVSVNIDTGELTQPEKQQ